MARPKVSNGWKYWRSTLAGLAGAIAVGLTPLLGNETTQQQLTLAIAVAVLGWISRW